MSDEEKKVVLTEEQQEELLKLYGDLFAQLSQDSGFARYLACTFDIRPEVDENDMLTRLVPVRVPAEEEQRRVKEQLEYIAKEQELDSPMIEVVGKEALENL